MPVAPLPNIDLPTIVVSASMAGASPEVMSTTVATPLERHLGAIAEVTEMTSRSSVGSTQVVLQFDISRDIDGAARDVQAAINAAHADLPAALRSNPTYRKFNPSSFPIMILALTSKTLTPGQIYDQASNILQQKLSQISGVGDVSLAGRLAAGGPHRTQSAAPCSNTASGWRTCAPRSPPPMRQQPQGRHRSGHPAAPGLCQRQCHRQRPTTGP